MYSCNKLTDCLNFAPARCTIDNAWASGNNAVGSMLTLANLSYNEIELLENLSDHVFLECLLLNHNRITSTIGLKDLRLLQVRKTNIAKITVECVLLEKKKKK